MIHNDSTHAYSMVMETDSRYTDIIENKIMICKILAQNNLLTSGNGYVDLNACFDKIGFLEISSSSEDGVIALMREIRYIERMEMNKWHGREYYISPRTQNYELAYEDEIEDEFYDFADECDDLVVKYNPYSDKN